MLPIPFKGWYAGVGSRETPEEILELMRRISVALYAQGFALSSGDAEGADTAFYEGALLSPHFHTLGARIYLAWNGVRNRYHDPKNYFFDASKFATWETANSIALEARGSWEGMGRGGIAMHTRNVFQIMGACLTDPVRSIVYWGKPVGKTEKVKGGTNTALQLAIKCGVKNRINLYTEEGMERATKFLDHRGNELKRAA
jgi:hypothetical protein